MIKINREILRLALPSVLANLTVPLVGMVDLIIVGHVSDAAAIGGIAIGTMLFDLLYWNFGFLRVGTGGMTAQAYGAGDRQRIMSLFSQSISIALGAALCIWLIQWLFVDFVLWCVPCSPEVDNFARQYFFIRVWAAPATLALMAFKGWFIGMQNTVAPMACDIVVNVLNMAASYYLAVMSPVGAIGVAWGTLIAQYSGLLLAVVLFLAKYHDYLPDMHWLQSLRWRDLKQLFVLNSNLFLRSLFFMVVYVGFTALASKFGDADLAISAIYMKLCMVFSFFSDGFAYAAEALVGRFVGSGEADKKWQTIRTLCWWAVALAVLFTFIYWLWGDTFFSWFTDDASLVRRALPYLPWLILMPAVSTFAFLFDGIFVGLTDGAGLRNAMIWAAAAFVGVYLLGPALHATCDLPQSIHYLYAAYLAHLVARSLYLAHRLKTQS